MTKGNFHHLAEAGNFASTRAAVGLHSRIFTSEGDGNIGYLEPHSGQYTKLTSDGGWKSRFLAHTDSRLYTLEESGTLFSISPRDGSYARVGSEGQWASTRACDAYQGKIYTCDENGSLYEIDPWTAEHRELGSSKWKSRILLDTNDYLVTLEESGTLFKIDPDDGSFEQIGEAEAWSTTTTMAAYNGSVFAHTDSGALWMIDIYDGSYERLGEASWKSRLLVMGDYLLYSLEESGDLYQIAIYGDD